MENSRRRVPQMVKVTRMINGPEAFTPDNEFCLGETEIAGLFVAAGFCAHGLAGAGGIGRVMAEWIAEGEPSLDLWHMDIRRFGRQYRPRLHRQARPRDLRDLLRHPLSAPRARVRPSPAFRRPTPGTASTTPPARSRAGSGSTGTRPTLARETMTLRPRGWAGRHWSPAIGAEHRACRRRRHCSTRARSPSSSSPDRAPPSSSSGSATTVAPATGRVTYTQMLNRGRHRVRLHRGAPGGGSLRDRHGHGIRQSRPRVDPPSPARDGSVQVQDLTSASACFGIWGRGRATCSLR